MDILSFAIAKKSQDKANSVQNQIDGMTVKSKNLFNKNTVTPGKYVRYVDGRILDSSSYGASDWISVDPNANYTVNGIGQIAFYNANKVYVSGVATGTEPARVLTIPSTAAYVRVSVRNADLQVYQLEKGSTATEYVPYGGHLDDNFLSEYAQERLIGRQYLADVFAELYNPFKITTIKVIGDSNAAGVGGTGYSATGEAITDGYLANEDGLCWANMLKSYVDAKFNKDTVVPVDNEHITISHRDLMTDSYTEAGVYARLRVGYTITFDFYGDHFSIFYTKTVDNGKFKITVDDVDVKTIDASAAENERRVEEVIDDLVDGKHTVKLTGIENVCRIEAVKVFKYAKVINWGTSGVTSYWIVLNLAGLIKAEDDIIMMLVGSNDRSTSNRTRYILALRRHIITIANALRAQNKKIVLLTSTPPKLAGEVDRSFHKEDVDNVMSSVSSYFNMEYISVYKRILDYAELRDIEINTLMSDDLHPNDAGYKVAYKYIMSQIGLAIPRDDQDWM